jgi:hypothetical protein
LLSLAVLEAAGKWSWIFFWMLPIAAVGTALLMARFLYLMHQLTEKQHAFSLLPALPWLALLSMILLAPLAFYGVSAPVTGIWSIVVAAAIAILVIRARPAWLLALVGRVPPGDLIGLLSAVRARCGNLTETWLSRVGGNL